MRFRLGSVRCRLQKGCQGVGGYLLDIVHVDRLSSIVRDGCLWCDAEMERKPASGTPIGMSEIKKRRREELRLQSHPNLRVGACVPFYLCPRSARQAIRGAAHRPTLEVRRDWYY